MKSKDPLGCMNVTVLPFLKHLLNLWPWLTHFFSSHILTYFICEMEPVSTLEAYSWNTVIEVVCYMFIFNVVTIKQSFCLQICTSLVRCSPSHIVKNWVSVSNNQINMCTWTHSQKCFCGAKLFRVFIMSQVNLWC